jgi:hypothetical protein
MFGFYFPTNIWYVFIVSFLYVTWLVHLFPDDFINVTILTGKYKLWFFSLCKFVQFPFDVDVCYVAAELQVWWLRVGLSSPVDQWTFMRALTGTDQLVLIKISAPMHRFRDINSETAETYVWVFGSLTPSTRFWVFCTWNFFDNDRYHFV